ncbi:MAG: peptidoglycan-associated lipoprotein Pal [Rubellimicrobium sp.]|nr:peptidoglycan-associated lipoprotein Pal [Rubellimicrobium sp.]
MRRFLTAALVIGVLALPACTRPDRFGGGANGADGGLGGAGGAGAMAGSASDPTSAAYFAQTVGDRVFFGVDQSTLSPAAMQTLDGQAQWLMTNASYLIVIEGHADEQGTREYNVALGARRANAVREYLISRGVPGNRLRTISYGKERPVATCASESCWSQNRRAVTVISISATS